jgi:hypothetical protein
MFKKRVVIVVSLALVLVFQASSFAQSGRVLKSLVFPGMGQLSDGQRLRGLAYMTGEVLLLTMTFSEFSHMESSSRETQVLTIMYDKAATFEEQNTQYSNWQDAFDKYGRSQLFLIGYAGAAALVWGLNVADAAFFAPKKSDEESLLLRTLRQNLAFSGGADRTKITYTIPF